MIKYPDIVNAIVTHKATGMKFTVIDAYQDSAKPGVTTQVQLQGPITAKQLQEEFKIRRRPNGVIKSCSQDKVNKGLVRYPKGVAYPLDPRLKGIGGRWISIPKPWNQLSNDEQIRVLADGHL